MQVRQNIGEHEFVAQSLLANHQYALAIERFALPGGRLGHVMHIGAETLLVADFVFAKSFLQSAHSDQADAAGMFALALFAFVDGALKGVIVSLQRFLQPAQMLKGITEIVIRPRETGIQPDRFLIEDQALLGAAHLCQHRRQRIPQHCFGWHAQNGAAQRFDRGCLLPHVALDAAQIVVAEGRIRARSNKEAKHLRSAVAHLQIPGRQPEIDKKLRIFRVERVGMFICHQRLVLMPHLLERHAKNMKGGRILRIRVGCFERKLACAHHVAALPRLHRTPERAVRFPADGRCFGRFFQHLQLGKGLLLRADCGERSEAGCGGKLRHGRHSS